MDVPNALNQLEELYAQRDALRLSKTDQKNAIVPADVKEALSAIDIEYLPKEEAIDEKIAQLEQDAKNQALEAATTIRGVQFMVVYTKGGKTVRAQDVLDLANRWEKTNPDIAAEIRSIIAIKKPSASIQAFRS